MLALRRRELSEKTGELERPGQHYIGLGIALGTAFGAAFGSALGNVGVGVGLGLTFGIIIGVVLANRTWKSDV